LKLSLRNKLIAVCLSTTVFVGLAIAFVSIVGGKLERAIFVVLGIGIAISLFEEFYIQRCPGRWLRSLHPVASITIYGMLVVIFAVTSFRK